MKKKLRLVLLIVCLFVFAFSGFKIYRIYHTSAQSAQFNEKLAQKAVTFAEPAPPQASREETTEETALLETAPLAVDFSILKKHSSDIIAWLYCADTPINLPVVQSGDNDYYLHRLPGGSSNYNGTLFLDYRNSKEFTDFTSIIYGHNMRDGSMFGTLPEYSAQEYYNAHPTWYLLTPERSYRVDLLAGYITESTSETYLVEYSYEEREAFLSNAMENSTFSSTTTGNVNDRFLILSTCSYEYDGARYVLVGKLTEVANLEPEGG